MAQAGEESDERQLVSVCILFRHGARAITENAVRSLKQGLPEDSGIPALDEWPTFGNLTSIGNEEMRNLGRWFREVYLPSKAPSIANRMDEGVGGVEWLSSGVPRARTSGEVFLSGFSPDGSAAREPATTADESPDDIFRAWTFAPSYREAHDRLRDEKPMTDQAVEQDGSMCAIYDTLTARKEGTQADSQAEAPLRAVDRLFNMMYVHELLECEIFWPGTAASIRGESRDEEGDEQSHPLTTAHTTLSAEQQALVEELSKFVWNRRFFNPQGRRLGLRLLRHMTRVLRHPLQDVGIFSGHDYTILALLATLRFPAYSFPVLGFGAYLLVECYRSPRPSATGAPVDALVVDIRLNPHPFAGAADGDPTTVKTDSTITIATEVDLATFEYLVQRMEPPPLRSDALSGATASPVPSPQPVG